MFRILLDISIFIAVIHGWWFVALPLGFIGAWKYGYFVELIVAGLAYDSLFGLVSEMGISGYVGILLSAVLFLGTLLLKKILRR